MKKSLFSGIILVLLCLSTGLFSAYKADNRSFEMLKNLEIFNSVFKELDLYYVDSIKAEEVIKNGIDAMLYQLDPYTTYIPESEQEDFATMTTGEYGGIGAIISQRGDTVFINEPYEGNPAQIYDLRAGDAIIAINGESMIKKSVSDVSANLKGEAGTTLELELYRGTTNETLNKTVERKKIIMNPVAYYGMLNDSIGYIFLSNFTDKAAKEMRNAVVALKEQNAKGIVIDLRNNPGGIMEDAIQIVNMFVPKGKTVLSTKGKIKNWDKTYQTTQEPIDTEIPLAVLVNRGSASASEIVSGALQDLDRAVIIGERTFGKGLVQSTRQLPYNGMLKITSAKYYIPSGRLIQAIDYSNRNEDGSVGRIPDSLTQVFNTANGREVRDGGGINPDFKVEPTIPSNLTMYLLRDFYVFDFANMYHAKHPSIGSPGEFVITEIGRAHV